MDSITLENVSKRFGGVRALAGVSFGIRRGETHAVVGENGAGKSTLMKLLAGVYRPDEGRILAGGEPVFLASPQEALRRGIRIVYQELSLYPHLSIAANLFINRELTRGGLLRRNEMNRNAAAALSAIGVDLDPRSLVSALSIGEKQLVEIARAIALQSEILILDEPNSALTEAESARLFRIIRRMRDSGVTVIYVSHRLEEVFSLCDRITVLRDGKYAGTWDTPATSVPEIISKMIGRAPGSAFPAQKSRTSDGAMLKVRNLSSGGSFGPVSLEAGAGEILGFAGLEGSGVESLFRILFGLKRADSGTVTFGGVESTRPNPARAIKQGWGLIPASRRDEGLMMRWSVQRNATILVLDRLMRALGVLNDRKSRNLARELVERLSIAADSIETPVMHLSGGNQQKVVLAKWLAAEPRILLLDDPTRGVDVGAKQEIYSLIRSLADRGLTVLFTSSEIEETIGLCDRTLVMRDGKIAAELVRGEGTKADILHAMSGVEIR